jgi:hypothetical protein
MSAPHTGYGLGRFVELFGVVQTFLGYGAFVAGLEGFPHEPVVEEQFRV